MIISSNINYNCRITSKDTTIKKELLIYLSILLLLALMMHQDAWFNAPLDHIANLHNSSLGVFHPLWISMIFYLIVLGIRKVASWTLRKLRRSGE